MALIIRLLCLFLSVGLLSAKDAAVVFVVDPLWDCVASYVANIPLLQEYKIVKVMTRRGKPPRCNSDYAYIYQNITYDSWTPNDSLAAEEICPKLWSLGVPIAAVIPTFDPAVALTDRVAACVGARGNPFDGPLAKARNNKWVMSEAVRKAGLRSVKEKLATTSIEAKEYLESLNPPLSYANPVVFKILEGSSSVGVTKVHSLEQAEEILSSELGRTSRFGSKIGKILIQEFLTGKEYVIDSVSRDGVHKVVNVWDEDIRPGNGKFNLYFGFKLMDPNDPKTKVIIDYANNVLDATGLQNGASDMEVKWVEEEGTPCVLDLNARWTALMWQDGLALEKATLGNDQITATINAYLDGDAFDKMPPVLSIKQHGAVVFPSLVYKPGILRSIPGLAVAKKLPSYFGSFLYQIALGHPTEQYPSPLVILLAHREKAVVDADYDRIIRLETSDVFWDITSSTGYASLTAVRPGDGVLLPYRIAAITALPMLVVASVWGLAAMSRRHSQDGTEYLIIE